MRINEINSLLDKELSTVQFRKLLTMIKSGGYGGDRRAASIKDRILSNWNKGDHTISTFQPDFEELGLDIKSALAEMEKE